MSYEMGDNTEQVSVTASDIVLTESTGDSEKGKKKKIPRRILHFSDGILEEYSTDEEEDEIDHTPAVDPKTLKWLPWMWHKTKTVSFGALAVADYCGEKLAWFFGITSPKYQAAIDEFHRIKQEEEEELAEQQRGLEMERQERLARLDKLEGQPPPDVKVAPDKHRGVDNPTFVNEAEQRF